MDHETRIALARRMTDFLRARHPDLLAAAVEGSTAKGEDREHSDLEMFAVTRDKPPVSGYSAIHGGVIVEVVVRSLAEAEEKVANVWDWPIAADGFLHALAMYDPEGLLPRWAARVSNPPADNVARALRGSFFPFHEDLCKIRNHHAAGEGELLRFTCPWIMLNAARTLGLLNRQPFNGMRNLLTKPRDFALLPEHFWEDYPALAAVRGDAGSLLAAAERLYQECRDLVAANGGEVPEDTSDFEAALERGASPR